MASSDIYRIVILEDSVKLLPNQLTNNLDNEILKNLKYRIEGKVGKNGLVIRIISLKSYDYGIISTADFSGATIYRVKYECLLCTIVRDTDIICNCENII